MQNKAPTPKFDSPSAFTDAAKLTQYLEEDPSRITCLECGKRYRSLASHLYRKHNLDAEAYKVKYGIPFQRGLVCLEMRTVQIAIARKRYAEGLLSAHPAKLGDTRPRKPLCPVLREKVRLANVARAARARVGRTPEVIAQLDHKLALKRARRVGT